MSHNQNDFPWHFDQTACKACHGKCCRGHAGYIWITKEESQKLAATKKIDIALFYRHYARNVSGRISLQERVINGEHFCCFFDPVSSRCAVYKNRPEQCATFPFWDSFTRKPQALLDICPGVSLKPCLCDKAESQDNPPPEKARNQ